MRMAAASTSSAATASLVPRVDTTPACGDTWIIAASHAGPTTRYRSSALIPCQRRRL
jgi:hypothetical protein